MNDDKYNPYNDAGLHYTKPVEAQPLEDRKDLMKSWTTMMLLTATRFQRRSSIFPKALGE